MLNISKIYKPKQKLGRILWENQISKDLLKEILSKLDDELKNELICHSLEFKERSYFTDYKEILRMCKLDDQLKNIPKFYFYTILIAWAEINELKIEFDYSYPSDIIIIKW